MTKETGKRMTSTRVAEIREELAALEARVDERLRRLEQAPDVGEVLAQELGQAALRTLRRPPRPPERTNL